MESNIPLLEESLATDPAREVQETCELALRRIKEQNSMTSADSEPPSKSSPFFSVDPAMPSKLNSSIDQLRYFSLGEH